MNQSLTGSIPDIESVAQDVLAAEGWGKEQFDRAMRIAEQILATPDEHFATTGGVLRDLPLPLHAWQVAMGSITLSRAS